MAVHDPLVMPLLEELLECLGQEVAKVEYPPLYVQPRIGETVDHLLSTSQDECCDGLAYVRPAGFFPSSGVFPAQDEAPLPKGILAWAVTFELGVIRCAPTPDEHSIPTAEQWQDLTQAVMDDGAAMRRAICCFIDAKPNRARNVLVGQWSPVGIQGGCVGGVIPLTVRGPVCDCAEAGPVSS
jgi:hypothetical protein